MQTIFTRILWSVYNSGTWSEDYTARDFGSKGLAVYSNGSEVARVTTANGQDFNVEGEDESIVDRLISIITA